MQQKYACNATVQLNYCNDYRYSVTCTGVRDYLADTVGVAVDGEIETPVVVDLGLPTIFGFVELLRPERGVVEVADKKTELLDEGFLDRRGASNSASMAACQRWTFI
jgi:hypothetical protein